MPYQHNQPSAAYQHSDYMNGRGNSFHEHCDHTFPYHQSWARRLSEANANGFVITSTARNVPTCSSYNSSSSNGCTSVPALDENLNEREKKVPEAMPSSTSPLPLPYSPMLEQPLPVDVNDDSRVSQQDAARTTLEETVNGTTEDGDDISGSRRRSRRSKRNRHRRRYATADADAPYSTNHLTIDDVWSESSEPTSMVNDFDKLKL